MSGSIRRKTAGLEHEQALWDRNYRHVYGFDEAGRGAWAGPVVAAAVCLPAADTAALEKLKGVYDSKQLTQAGREALFELIQSCALASAVGSASHHEIDEIGIAAATKLAMNRALSEIVDKRPDLTPDYFLLDALKFHWGNVPFLALVKGDQRSLTIAAASILAKVYRDRVMVAYASQYPNYGFAAHKGYGTQRHRNALGDHGASPIHRMSFAPLRHALF